jgi:NAD dependent epimerase/dehydratase family enzyme
LKGSPARAVALYGSDAPKMLLDHAELADEFGDKVSAKEWREVAAIAERITRSG